MGKTNEDPVYSTVTCTVLYSQAQCEAERNVIVCFTPGQDDLVKTFTKSQDHSLSSCSGGVTRNIQSVFPPQHCALTSRWHTSRSHDWNPWISCQHLHNSQRWRNFKPAIKFQSRYIKTDVHSIYHMNLDPKQNELQIQNVNNVTKKIHPLPHFPILPSDLMTRGVMSNAW